MVCISLYPTVVLLVHQLIIPSFYIAAAHKAAQLWAVENSCYSYILFIYLLLAEVDGEVLFLVNRR